MPSLFNQPLETRPVTKPQWHYVSDFYVQCPCFCDLSSSQSAWYCSPDVIWELEVTKTGNGAQRPASREMFLLSGLWSDLGTPLQSLLWESQTGNDNTSCCQVKNYQQIPLLSPSLSLSLWFQLY